MVVEWFSEVVDWIWLCGIVVLISVIGIVLIVVVVVIYFMVVGYDGLFWISYGLVGVVIVGMLVIEWLYVW